MPYGVLNVTFEVVHNMPWLLGIDIEVVDVVAVRERRLLRVLARSPLFSIVKVGDPLPEATIVIETVAEPCGHKVYKVHVQERPPILERYRHPDEGRWPELIRVLEEDKLDKILDRARGL